MTQKQNKKIFKNAMLLFLRMIFNTAATLYTSRILLQSLGVDDFGLYYVVAGFIFLLGFFHGSMTSATQRFISFELGNENTKTNVNNIFNMSFNIHIILGLIIFIFAETAGLWFLRNELTIPAGRLQAAEYVYHFSLISFFLTMLSVPFSATIIANENMGAYAKITILDVLLKLSGAVLLTYFAYDRLFLYGLFVLISTFLISGIYYFYTLKKYTTTKVKIYWDRLLFIKMISFIGWNLWGNAALVLSNHGINIILNIFFSPAINASRTISFQVSSALNNFIQSIQMAFNPQIIKSYASGESHNMMSLVFQNSKYNFTLMLLLFCPISMSMDTVLFIWLKDVPNYAATFTNIILITSLIDCLSGPLITTALATGRIKLYQIVVGGLLLFNIPISYVFLINNFPPVSVFYIGLSISVIALLARMFMLKYLISFSPFNYAKSVLLPCSLLALLTVPLLSMIRGQLNESLLSTLLIFPFICLLIISLCFYCVSLNRKERRMVNSAVIKLLNYRKVRE